MPGPHPVRTPNRAARLARWLAQVHGREPGWRLAVMLAVAIGGWLGLTGWGAWLQSVRTHGALDPVDLIYGPLTFLTPQSGYGPTARLSWQDDIGRCFGVALPVIGAAWAVLRWASLGLARRLCRGTARGQTVLIGAGGSADDVAILTARQGAAVVLIDPSLEGEGDRARRLGGDGIVGIASDFLGAERADATPADPGAILAWSGDDSCNVAIAAAAMARDDAPADIHARVEDATMQAALRQAPLLIQRGRVRLRPISLEDLALREGLGNAALVDEAVTRGQPAVHVCLWGDTRALRKVAALVMAQSWSMHLGPPRLTLIGGGSPVGSRESLPEISQPWTDWRRHYRGLFAPDMDIFEPEAQPRFDFGDGVVLPPAITRHIVAGGDDEGTLVAALGLAARLVRAEERPAPVQAILLGGQARELIADLADFELAAPLIVGEPRPAQDIVQRRADEAAGKQHLAYLRHADPSGPDVGKDWSELEDTYVHANRAAVAHVAVKRYDWARAARSGLADVAIVEAMAKVEHHRWCAERLLDGWLPGNRDNRRRRHPGLRPWADLDEPAREKDRVQVRQMLG